MPYSFDSSTHRAIGYSGEDLAIKYFTDRGYRFIDKNVQYRFGEIDVIVEKDACWHFVEVKYRRSLTFGYPEEGVSYQKLRKVRLAALKYLQSSIISPKEITIDVLSILKLPGKEMEFVHITPAIV